MNKTLKYIVALTVPALVLGALVSSVSADTATSTSGSVSHNASSTVRTANKVAKLIATSDKEITNRINSLNKLNTKIQGMKNVSDAQKASISTQIQASVASLTTLKAKIDADTDLTTLNTDRKSITIGYRIYALVEPQTSISANADRVNTQANSLASSTAKLQTKVAADQTAGKNVASSTALFTDITAKLADARTQAQAAVAEVVALTPDNGNDAQFTANKQAIADARMKIKTANADLQTVRKDIQMINKIVRAAK